MTELVEHVIDTPGEVLIRVRMRDLATPANRVVHLTPAAPAVSEPDTPTVSGSDENPTQPLTMAQAEREAIVRALAYTHGRLGKAADLLEISRSSMYRKVRLYRIPARFNGVPV